MGVRAKVICEKYFKFKVTKLMWCSVLYTYLFTSSPISVLHVTAGRPSDSLEQCQLAEDTEYVHVFIKVVINLIFIELS